MTIKEQIYEFISRRGPHGATDEEIQKGLHIAPDSERPARVQLVKENWVVDSGMKRGAPNAKKLNTIWFARPGKNVSIVDNPSMLE